MYISITFFLGCLVRFCGHLERKREREKEIVGIEIIRLISLPKLI